MKNKRNIKKLNKNLESHQKDFEKMMQEIEPFIRKKDIIITSTVGKWLDGNSLHDLQEIQRQKV